MWCLLRGDESEEVQRGCGEAPARCVIAVVTAKAACEMSGFGGFTLSNGVWWGSGTMTAGPAWRWPPRCGAVWVFLTFYRRGIVFRQQLPGQEKVGSRGILACSAAVACSL